MQINTEPLINKKNLLAFSAGVDSSALFFVLIQNKIDFDIAIVDYNLREQSKQEVEYANFLATKYNKKCHIKNVNIKTSNFEKNAREVRYCFFEELILEYNYENLLTAHQLNDKLEWFLMQLSKGAGLVELIGLNEIDSKDNYTLIRPILNYSKDELIDFLNENKIKYFTDESNFSDKYRRNYFRKNFADKFLLEFKDGVKRSFDYLNNDLNSLNIDSNPLFKKFELEIFKNSKDNNKNIRVIDKSIKKRGLLLTKKQRDEILRQREITISNKVVISIFNDLIWLAPLSNSKMDKKFKELCRLNKIPKNIRPYLMEKNINLEELINI